MPDNEVAIKKLASFFHPARFTDYQIYKFSLCADTVSDFLHILRINGAYNNKIISFKNKIR